MAQTIKLRRSATSGAIPTTSQIELGELALNTYDGKVYMKKNVGGTESIVEVTGSSASGGGTGVFYTDEFSGDGNTAGFTLSVAPVSEDDLIVFIDGVYQNLNSYSISGTTLTFDTAPDNGTTVIVHHVQGGILGTAPAIDTMTGDGSDTTLTLSVAPSSENQTFVTFDGVVQHKSTYSISGTTLTFSEAVPNGVAVECITFKNVQVATFEDADGDTKIQVEETADEDIIRFDVAGTEVATMTGDGIVTTLDIEANEIIGDLRGAVLFKAQAGEDLTKGDIVYISGISGNTTVVSKADADDTSKMPAFGVASETASNNSSVTIYTFGTLSSIDTSSFTEGDELFVSTTAGAFTNSAPTGESSQIQKIAKVTRSDSSAGSIKIMGAGRSNAVPNLDDGNIFIGNGSNQAVTASLDTEIESYLDGGTSTPTFASAIVSGDLTVDTNRLYVDSTNDRVGIGLSTPPHRFSVGSANDDGIALYNGTNDLATIFRENNEQARFSLLDTGTVKVRLSSKSNDVNYINNGGNVGIGTDDPAQALHIADSSGSSILEIQRTDTNTTGTVGAIQFNANDDHAVSAIVAVADGDNEGAHLTFKTTSAASANSYFTSTTERMRIDSSGNVAIGTTSARTTGGTAKLSVEASSVVLNIGESNNDCLYVRRIDTGDYQFQTYKSGNDGDIQLQPYGGNVGIGSTGPQSRLDLGALNTSGGGISFGTTLTEIRRGGTNGDTLQTSHWGNVAVLIDSDNNDTSTRAFKVMEGNTDAGTANELFRVRADGRVGIGTTSPAYELDIKSASSDVASLRVLGNGAGSELLIETTTNNANGTVKFGDLDDNDIGYIQYGHSANYLRFGTNATERMRIDSSGNVGIGTDSPQAVGGHTGVLTLYGSNATALVTKNSSSSSRIAQLGSDLAFFVNTYENERMRIDSSGDVGIGTDSPSALLHLNASSNAQIRFSDTQDPLNNFIGLQTLSDGLTIACDEGNASANSRIIFKIDGSEVGRFEQGDFGIGTSDPTAALTVSGTATDCAIDFTNTTTSTGRSYRWVSHNAGSFKIEDMSASGTERLRVESDGDVSIGGMAPQAKLDVDGSILIRASGVSKSEMGIFFREDFVTSNKYNCSIFAHDHSGSFSDGISINGSDGISFCTGSNSRNERARFDINGRFTIGETSALSFGDLGVKFNGTSSNGIVLETTRDATGSTFIRFNDSDSAAIGSIYQDGASSVLYAETSDYRLKENIIYDWSALDRLNQLKPAQFNFIGDNRTINGFIAHEVENIVPEAIVGEKDAVNEDGSIKPQNIDKSRLVPLLVKAVQEQQEQIESLKREIGILKGEVND